MSLATGSGTTRSPFSIRGYDFYASPIEAPLSLLDEYQVPEIIHEPACGDGALVDVFRQAGRTVYASDLIDRGCQDSYVADFLAQKEPIPGVQACITNPPYRYAEQFVRKSRELYPLTIMLLRLAFLESVRRTDILDTMDLEAVLLYSKRLPRMHRGDYEGKKNTNSAMPFAWYVWNRSYNGPITVRRITYKKQPPPQIKLDFRLSPTPIEGWIQSKPTISTP